ncbi:MAG: thiamine biosynthesis lipoprotein ApbE [Devosia sp.]|uniref:FAD:protein FMN transferase n=1 Tax=Devosia sp. TaxID=1871048 RepID=UPI002629411F|nr:FAD:protein FMN transferase [Devosia sp.]MDB5586468.1 thiamine biosynthesis lipoprotein ApbE [Devosia sp.]
MSFWRRLFGSTRRPVAAPRLQTFGGDTMGTRYSVKLVATAGPDLAAIQAEAHAAIDAVDAQMSTWKPQSDLSRFNASEPGDWFAVAPDLAKVVALGLEISALTDGAFDICVGSAVNHWGFGPDAAPVDVLAPPTDLPGFRSIAVRLDPPALRKSGPVYLDLSGIAKGFGVDAIATVLERHGIAAYMIEIDGELRAKGTRPDGTPWRVGISQPEPGATGVHHVLALPTTALATSGDYRRYFDVAGQRYSHTIDPRTGRPTTSTVASVTVADPDCARADALATALLVLGADKGPAMAQRLKLDALFLIRDEGGLTEKMTGRFDRFFG